MYVMKLKYLNKQQQQIIQSKKNLKLIIIVSNV